MHDSKFEFFITQTSFLAYSALFLGVFLYTFIMQILVNLSPVHYTPCNVHYIL